MSALGLIWANLQRRKIRTYLTIFSLLVAFLLFTVLRTVAVWFEQGIGDTGGADRLVVTAKYSIIESLPISQRAEILAVDGVEAITHMTWFGGNYQDPRNFFPKYPVEPLGYFEMFPEYIIDPDQLNAFANTRTGAVAPAGMLEQYGWQIGDRIPIEADIYPMSDGSRLWEFDLVARTPPRQRAARRPFSSSTTTTSTRRANSAKARWVGGRCVSATPTARRKYRAPSIRCSRTR